MKLRYVLFFIAGLVCSHFLIRPLLVSGPKPAPAAASTKPAIVLPEPGREELKMQKYHLRRRYITEYGRKLATKYAEDVLLCGRWTRYYARIAGQEKKMSTMMCMWHTESRFKDEPGADGKSFGRAQTLYETKAELRKWWLDNYGVTLDPDDSAISTQMAYGVAEFTKKQFNNADIWTTVRRYNGCGVGAVNYAKIVFELREEIYGLKAPKPKPSPCPVKKHKKKGHKTKKK